MTVLGDPRVAGWLVAAAVTLCALVILLLVAHRIGVVDDGRDAPERKRQTSAVPSIGGPALFVGLIAPWLRHAGEPYSETLVSSGISGWFFDSRALLAACALAFATGFVDDVRAHGISAGWKLAGQALAGLALSSGLVIDGAHASVAARIACTLAAVCAQNAANTFDNADGALAAVGCLGCAIGGSSFAGALCAFLPFNVVRRRATREPFAYLGDSGSHLIGIVLLATPIAIMALVLPVLDLMRVVYVRIQDGVPIWRGDRRHIAQRLLECGFGRGTVIASLCVCALPAIAAERLAQGSEMPAFLRLIGVALSALGLAAAARRSALHRSN